ncbi:MAG TPA: hypothetical protein VFG20_21485 [Planctomycetaceae bacterium]|nr:hypothetical protein [Planctomycetaceae bacterium]
MGRAIVVMVSTLLFAMFGLFVAWLNVQAVLASQSHVRQTETIMMSYAFGPLLGSAMGFGLSLFSMWLFSPVRRSP